MRDMWGSINGSVSRAEHSKWWSRIICIHFYIFVVINHICVQTLIMQKTPSHTSLLLQYCLICNNNCSTPATLRLLMRNFFHRNCFYNTVWYCFGYNLALRGPWMTCGHWIKVWCNLRHLKKTRLITQMVEICNKRLLKVKGSRLLTL